MFWKGTKEGGEETQSLTSSRQDCSLKKIEEGNEGKVEGEKGGKKKTEQGKVQREKPLGEKKEKSSMGVESFINSSTEAWKRRDCKQENR